MKIVHTDGRRAGMQLAALRAGALVTSRLGNKGMGRLTWAIADLGRFQQDNSVTLRTPEDSLLTMQLSDGYWSRLLSNSFEYEPELERMLLPRLDDGDNFLDLGANLGYWTIRAIPRVKRSGARVVAVEASPERYKQLAQNCRQNPGPATPLLSAVWSSSGEEIEIVSHYRNHAGNSAVDRVQEAGEKGYRVDRIPTVTIDDLVDQHLPESTERGLVIKLDVEGAEVPALEGASKTLDKHRVTFLYEDHGHDVSCASSLAMLSAGLTIRHQGRPITVDHIRMMKTDPRKGYNFVAVNW